MLRFGVQSWASHATPVGAIFGWALVLAGSTVFFLSAFGTPARYIPGWLAYLGRISYGLYIFHSLVLHLVFKQGGHWLSALVVALHLPQTLQPAIGVALVLAITILVSHLSYRYSSALFCA